ncbi:phosphate/phosphite/phosphonate ABC transporter substrate-binding protein [Thiomicrorhabdus indica]|uniref:phosphate/phosphite/phosphonate ABC transporter substrate-binding protein n=1 Tax=Thiomicrorhabdus indica TaxID=2267253 RepID=UPI00102DF9E1|nr:phosphate/phosphite/phosphonate ABC transporter substrate-binding protein [Thiomicrorhabdus indica]
MIYLHKWRFKVLALIVLSLSFPIFAQDDFQLAVVNERPDRSDHALKQYLPLNNYLKQKLSELNIQVAPLVVVESIEELAILIENGKVDAIFEGVIPSLILKKRTQKLHPELLIWRKGQRQYHSVFFTHRKNKLNSLENLSGHLMAFEAPRSTSAYFIPKITLESLGYQLMEFGQATNTSKTIPYVFSGSESNQAYWVHNRKAQVGAFNNGDWERIPTVIKKDLKIIGQTRPILRWLFSFTSSTSNRIKNSVNQILVDAHLSEEGQKALKAAANIKKIEHLSSEDQENLKYWDNLLHH